MRHDCVDGAVEGLEVLVSWCCDVTGGMKAEGASEVKTGILRIWIF